ncbi:hypothetical protein RHO12_12740 (plasmid) [Orbus sturtevantii]|uniref:hypothetical protein n=1 Tax=Orbus sturtevantii TaxID=3074109 RepID=UPI00370D3BF5
MSDLLELSSKLQRIQNQIPYATALALTKTARSIEQAQKKALIRKLDRPTPFTVNSVGSIAARKDNLFAKVFVRDIAAEYLKPFEFGGEHKLNSKAVLAPINVTLNKYGNLPRTKMKQLTNRKDTFVGEVGGISGVWQRVKPRKSKKKKGRSARSPNGLRVDRQKQPHPKLLISFEDPLEVKPILGYMDRAEKMISTLFPTNLESSIREAIRTAK